MRIPSLQHRPEKARALEQRLSQDGRIASVRAAPVTGSVVVVFEEREVDAPAVIALVEEMLRAPDRLPQRGVLDTPHERPGWKGLLGISCFTLYYLFRQLVLKSPLSTALSLLGIGLAALPLFGRALRDLGRGRLLGANTFLTGATLLAAATREHTAALEVIWVQEVGRFLEETLQERSRRAIREALLTAPGNAYVLVDGAEVETPLASVRTGDRIVVHGSEGIAVDGKVVSGEALVDESHITGRAEPVLKNLGNGVFAGTTLKEGVLTLEAQRVGPETYLARITRMVETSLREKTETEEEADRLAARLTAWGLGASAATFLWTRNLATTLSVQLALASPCATVLAASSAVAAAMACAARNRVLVKGGRYLEQMVRVDCICFDKTGTLTEDLPVVAEVIPASEDVSRGQLIRTAAEAQGHSNHPVARALIQASSPCGGSRGRLAVSESLLGRGVRACLEGDLLLVGNAAFMAEQGVPMEGFGHRPHRMEAAGGTLVYVARNGEPRGVIVIRYGLKEPSRFVVQQLRQAGVAEIHLVSGDREEVVAEAAERLGVTAARGNMRPEDKARYVAGLTRQGRVVAMVGDGINDAPALAQAGIGIAMGAGGAKAAVEASDIALLDSRLDRLLFVRGLSRETLRTISWNHRFALITDLLSAALAVSLGLPPILSGAAHFLHTGVLFARSGRLLSYSLAAAETPNARLSC